VYKRQYKDRNHKIIEGIFFVADYGWCMEANLKTKKPGQVDICDKSELASLEMRRRTLTRILHNYD